MTYSTRDTMIEALRKLFRSGAGHDAGAIADTALSVISNHLANEPRTKAEMALIEFAEGKARAMRDKGFERASDRAIPSSILQAFVEELK